MLGGHPRAGLQRPLWDGDQQGFAFFAFVREAGTSAHGDDTPAQETRRVGSPRFLAPAMRDGEAPNFLRPQLGSCVYNRITSNQTNRPSTTSGRMLSSAIIGPTALNRSPRDM